MKFICIGRNYVEHIEELKNQRPEFPVIFLKPDTASLTGNKAFYHPEFSTDIHYEVEVLVKISKTGKHIQPKFVANYYEEIGLGIDFTARDLQKYQKEKGLPWEIAKAFDYSAVISDFVPKSKFDLSNINFSLMLNSTIRQKANTSLMIWTIDEIIVYVSQFITLKVGDILFTGTPNGVGKIQIGDKIEGFLENERFLDFQIK